jgi:hypothetical protein
MKQQLDESQIVSILKELDSRLDEHFKIIICGGAAAIVGYGLKRFTGDIDIMEPSPKTEEFFSTVRKILEGRGLDPTSINDAAKGYADLLTPDFQNRLIPLEEGFRRLQVLIISKADFITMKLCAWREADALDIRAIGISKEDLPVIRANLAHVATHSPDKSQKAYLVLSELGVLNPQALEQEKISTLSELILFYNQNQKQDPSLELIRSWRNRMDAGEKPAAIAISLVTSKQKQGSSLGMSRRAVPCLRAQHA